jgi:hypothetical protein
MKVNVALIKLMQFITFSLFLFSALIYEGTFLLLPLDVLYQVTRGLQALGLPVVLALASGCGVVAYAGYSLWKRAGLCEAIVETGMELLQFGSQQARCFDAMAVKAGAEADPDAAV